MSKWLKGFTLFLLPMFQLPSHAADYPPNIDYGSQGDFLAKRAVEHGRSSIISTIGPILISNPQLDSTTGFAVDSVVTDTSWDLSDLTNPTLIQYQNCNGDDCYAGKGPHAHAHLTTYHEGEAYLDISRALPGGDFVSYDPNGLTSIEQMVFSRDPLLGQIDFNGTGPTRLLYKGYELGTASIHSHLTSPYYTVDYWQYDFNPSEQFSIRNTNRSWGTDLAKWDHMGLTGAAGFVIFSGNLMIFASDQQQTGLAIYDISGLQNGKKPRLVSRFNPELQTPNGLTERLGGYWVEPYGANKVVWSARKRNNIPARAYSSLFMADFTDPVNPKITCEIYFNQDDSAPEDGSRFSNPMYVNYQDQYAYVDHFKVDLDKCEQAYADNHIDDEEFFDIVEVFNDTQHSCDASQYFRPLGQVGVFGGMDSSFTNTVIEHSGGAMIEGPWHRVFRNGQYVDGFTVGTSNDDGVTITKVRNIQVGDVVKSLGNEYTITNVVVDERVNEEGMCFFVTSDEPDTNPPYVSGHRPLANQTNVPVDTFIHLHIPETLRTETVGNAFTVTNTRTNETIDFRLQSSHTGTISIFPEEDLIFGDEYRVNVVGIQDFMGNTMEDYSFTFTTGESELQPINLTPQTPAPSIETPFYPNHSGNIACEVGSGYDSIWAVNSDNGTVSEIIARTDENTFDVSFDVEESAIGNFGGQPSSVTKISNILAVTYSDQDRVRLFRVNSRGVSAWAFKHIYFNPGDRPVASIAHGNDLYVSLYGSGEIAKVDLTTFVVSRLKVGPKPKAMALTSDGSRLLVTRFISTSDYAEVYDINTAGNMSFRDPSQPSIKINKVLVPDDLDHGSGVPNYLRSIVIDPNNEFAYVTANKANIDRGLYLSGEALDDDSTIRPMIATIDLVNHRDVNLDPITRAGTIDLDNAADPSGITFLPDGVTRAHSLQGNNVVQLTNLSQNTIARVSSGMAPQSLCTTTRNLYVKNFTDRTVTAIDTANFMHYGVQDPNVQTLITVAPENDVKTADELLGLQVFYHARTPDISPEGYISCASCHDDGGHDGMTWDLTHMGEGLRNTISLRGTSGTRFGNLHWSANFDEVQDFEAQLEGLNGADGLIEGTTFTNNVSPLTHITAGESEDLDALAAYVSSLGKNSLMTAPNQCVWGDDDCWSTYWSGHWQYTAKGCAECHSRDNLIGAYRDGLAHDMGTIKESSGSRLGGPLTEIRTPPLIELWDTAPYLHDGSAATLEEVLTTGVHGSEYAMDERERTNLIQFLMGLDRGKFIEDDEEFSP